MKRIATLLHLTTHNEDGQDLVEYGLLCGFVSLAAVGALLLARTAVGGLWSSIQATIQALPIP